MDWTQVLFLAATLSGLDFLSRKRIDAIEVTLNEMKNEMKDFHGRLCTLEERYLQIITKQNQ